MEYNFHEHVASDIGLEQKFLPPSSYATQDTLNYISNWTDTNLMKLNTRKCSYMMFTKSQEVFTTRLTIKNSYLERLNVTKLLGVWISEDMSWSRNCQEICRKAYSRLSMITKLKYAGAKVEDLLDIYVLFIRSITEYCGVAFHSSLTIEQSNKLEQIQKVCLKIILAEMYISYSTALEMTGLKLLSERRNDRCLDFARKCVKHPKNSRFFPLKTPNDYSIRTSDKFKVNFASRDYYKNSAIPYCQRLLNDFYHNK